MADVLISGNTYQNIGFVRFRQPSGELVTFVEESRNTSSPTASFVSARLGVTGIKATVGSALIENIPTPTVELKLTL